MARAKKNNPTASSAAPTLWLRATGHALLAAVLIGSGSYGFLRLRGYVEQQVAANKRPPQVVLKSKPVWMSQTLAEQIAASAGPTDARSVMDRSVLESVETKLRHNAWVRQVKQVRRAFGQAPGDTIQIDCEFRAPMALVLSSQRAGAATLDYFLIDAECYRLPEKYPANRLPRVMFDSDGRVSMRIIEGVAAAPPREGERWAGEDLAAGLDLVKLLYGREFTDQIERIDVSNFGRRRRHSEPELALVTKFSSRVEWGEPVKRLFYSELPPLEKLQRLEKLYSGPTGRVDGGYSWSDPLRLDRPLVHGEEARLVQAPQRPGSLSN